MRFYLTVTFLFVTFVTTAQFSEDFSDGDFTVGPTWTGITANFEVDGENRLHLNAPAESDTSYLSVATTTIDDATWDFWLHMDFNPSSSNYSRVYLVSDQENLMGTLNGYYVMVGNTADEISLYRQDGTSVTKIIDGADDVVDVDGVEVRVRVTRDAAGNWELLRDATGGYSFTSEGTVNDITYTSTAYFGVFCKYTSTRSTLFYFDELGVPYVDAVPPTLTSVTALSATELDVLFSEPVDPVTAEAVANYSVDGGVGTPVTAGVDMTDPALVHLTFGTSFTNGASYNLTVSNVEDLDGNSIASPSVEPFIYFMAEEAAMNDVIITELLADPNPIVGLPEQEFFEIYNRSTKIFDLEGWTINDNSTLATFGSYILEPGAYLVICSPGEGAAYEIANYLEVDGLPTLTNSEDDLVLKSIEGIEVDSIHYQVGWYADAEKDDGGWTLERKHLDSPCSDGGNWGASINPDGGTPGMQNSIWTDEDDTSAPYVTNVGIVDETAIELTFNESMDTLVPLTLEMLPTVAALSGTYTSLDVYSIEVDVLAESTIYELTVTNGADCWGNPINATVQLGLPAQVSAEDIIINEILFNPLSYGTDYVELYNVSDKVLDLHTLRLANWDVQEDTIGNFELIGEEQLLVLPGEYVLLTEDSLAVIDDFAIYGIGSFVQTNLPSYNNDSGTVFLFGPDSNLVDYISYDEDMHYALLATNDGKALERITFGGGMNNPDNWHTASENVDWGTPGYKNSQFTNPNVVGTVSLDPQLFSPDNDGYNDVLTISFDLEDTDNVMDVRIYDNQGRLVRLLKDNFFIGNKGTLFWDGINDEGSKAAIGTYVVLVSVKNSNGDEQLFKLVTVLAGQL